MLNVVYNVNKAAAVSFQSDVIHNIKDGSNIMDCMETFKKRLYHTVTSKNTAYV